MDLGDGLIDSALLATLYADRALECRFQVIIIIICFGRNGSFVILFQSAVLFLKLRMVWRGNLAILDVINLSQEAVYDLSMTKRATS